MKLKSDLMLGTVLLYEYTLTPSEFYELGFPDRTGRKLRIMKGMDGRFHALNARDDDHKVVRSLVPDVVFSASWR